MKFSKHCGYVSYGPNSSQITELLKHLQASFKVTSCDHKECVVVYDWLHVSKGHRQRT